MVVQCSVEETGSVSVSRAKFLAWHRGVDCWQGRGVILQIVKRWAHSLFFSDASWTSSIRPRCLNRPRRASAFTQKNLLDGMSPAAERIPVHGVDIGWLPANVTGRRTSPVQGSPRDRAESARIERGWAAPRHLHKKTDSNQWDPIAVTPVPSHLPKARHKPVDPPSVLC